jgi:uncharacterized membrane protein YbaN (DUF454 family)
MKRRLWTAAGLVFVGIGAVGAVLPLLPTVPFLLLALFCFARGNPVWEQRLLDHPRYGPLLLDWRTRRAIPRRAKWAALIAMAISVVVTALDDPDPAVQARAVQVLRQLTGRNLGNEPEAWRKWAANPEGKSSWNIAEAFRSLF